MNNQRFGSQTGSDGQIKNSVPSMDRNLVVRSDIDKLNSSVLMNSMISLQELNFGPCLKSSGGISDDHFLILSKNEINLT